MCTRSDWRPLAGDMCRALMKMMVIMVMVGGNITSSPVRALGSWSASTVIDVVADLLKPSDDESLQSYSDPLLHSDVNKHHHHTRKVTKSNSTSDGGDVLFMVPMLSTSIGDNNQVIEYMTAIVMARATKRTLCLTPFFPGPTKHTGKLSMGRLSVEDRFDMKVLRKFVKLSSLQRCHEKCSMSIHGFWWLRHSTTSSLGRYWKSASTVKHHELGEDFVNWNSVDDIRQAVEGFNNGNERCVALGGLFPGLRWRGAYLAPSLYMPPSQSILKVATALQELAFGEGRNFLAVHWRFEESLCGGGGEEAEEIGGPGLCFLRCGDGSVIDSGLQAAARGLPALSKGGPIPPSTPPRLPRAASVSRGRRGAEGGGQRRRWARATTCSRHIPDATRVVISKRDLVAAILGKASKENVSSVYVATDGWLRGSHAQALVRQVVEDLRSKGLGVVGLWRINSLPNVIYNQSEAMYIDKIMKSVSHVELSGHVISKVEQEICSRAISFMGSGESTWSLVVFRARLATRRLQKIIGSRKIDQRSNILRLDDEDIIDELLHDSHAAGLQCRYRYLYRRSHSNAIVPQESYQDEAPDTWLDMEACEAQLSQGGSCKLLDCFP